MRLRRLLKRTAFILAAALLIRTMVGEAALVPTSSMEGTILVGDHIFLNKLLYAPQIPFTGLRLPRLKRVVRGNIVAFHYPKDQSLNFLKRVVAIGGDVVEIKDDILYVNQIPVREPYAVHSNPPWKRHPDSLTPRLVPLGQLFVLGDNRDNSDDSRFWGTVPVENVIGEPLFVFWSYDAPSAAWLNDSPRFQLRFYSSIVSNLFARTRWNRLGVLL